MPHDKSPQTDEILTCWWTWRGKQFQLETIPEMSALCLLVRLRVSLMAVGRLCVCSQRNKSNFHIKLFISHEACPESLQGPALMKMGVLPILLLYLLHCVRKTCWKLDLHKLMYRPPYNNSTWNNTKMACRICINIYKLVNIIEIVSGLQYYE